MSIELIGIVLLLWVIAFLLNGKQKWAKPAWIVQNRRKGVSRNIPLDFVLGLCDKTGQYTNGVKLRRVW